MISPYLEYGLIPVGWDTGVHLFYTRLILDGEWALLFELTRGNNILPSFLVAIVSIPLSGNIFLSRILIALVLPIALIIVFYWLSKGIHSNPNFGALAVVVTSLWLSTYRLSADLHRTLIAYILVLPLLLFFSTGRPTNRKRAGMMLLVCIASFAQIEVVVLILGVAFLTELWRILVSRRVDRKKLLDIVAVSLGVIPAFLIAISYSTYFITVAITYNVPLAPLELETVFLYLGGPLIPITIYGLYSMAREVTSGALERGGMVQMLSVSIFFFLIVPSFFIAEPTIFRRMAPRALTILPTPLLVVEGARSLYEKATKTGRRTGYRGMKIPEEAVILPIVYLIIFSAALIPFQSSIHQKPFVNQVTMDQLKAIGTSTSPNALVLSIMQEGQVHAYRDYGWAGALLGYNEYFNGPLAFLAAGVIYPTENPQQLSAMEVQLERMRNRGIEFPINDSNIEIAVSENLYGPLTSTEMMLAQEVGEGAYIINGQDLYSLLSNYSVYGATPYGHDGDWQFDLSGGYYARLIDDNLTGVESITYALVAHFTGNYSLTIQYRNVQPELHGFGVQVNDTEVAVVNYWGAMDYRNISVDLFLETRTIVFVTLSPLSDGPGEITIKELILEFLD
jgi:hypothetical protein